MTLVIAQRNDKGVSFSSDSRISFGEAGFFDKGIKIFTVPFKLKGPAKSREDFNKYEHELSYGLAVVGSSINANTVKDSIAEILPNVTYLTNMSDVSIIGISSLVLKYYREVSQELTAVLGKTGLSEILLGGYCIVEKRVRIVRFYPDIKEDQVDYQFEEILPEHGMMFFGSGKAYAEQVFKENETLDPLQILKKVIESKADAAVGGNMQRGNFYGENFKISGVVEVQLDEKGNSIKKTNYRRAFLVENEIEEFKKPPYLALTYGYTSVKLIP
ncbi:MULTISPECIES: hypothetical protein [Pedobacter]|uniref:Uncharacterized protein n=1 Tax=Pedobacter roseus TaxID=336820 RepID=A0A7G9QH70_9SPHI|nr:MULTISPECIES: hypothetical protein [Pedobacter]QNN42695.1 hypothetical protein H9L23_00820 [Pedobacter roseus]